LHGYAEVAKHQIIEHKMQHIGELSQQLKQLMSEEEVAQFVVQVMDQAQEKHSHEQPSPAIEIRYL
jgi:hypothetical protein